MHARKLILSTFSAILFPVMALAATQGAIQGGIKDYSVPPIAVTNACPSTGHVAIINQGSSASAGTFTSSSTTGTTCAVTWNAGQFPQALSCTVTAGNAAGLSGGVVDAIVTYASNVPTLTINWSTTEVSATWNYVCVGQ